MIAKTYQCMSSDHSFSQKVKISGVSNRNPPKIENPLTDSDSLILSDNWISIFGKKECSESKLCYVIVRPYILMPVISNA